jgi:hypothetical protein
VNGKSCEGYILAAEDFELKVLAKNGEDFELAAEWLAWSHALVRSPRTGLGPREPLN